MGIYLRVFLSTKCVVTFVYTVYLKNLASPSPDDDVTNKHHHQHQQQQQQQHQQQQHQQK